MGSSLSRSRLIAIAALMLVVAGSMAMVRANWPADCDPQGHRFELVTAYGCSGRLLSGGALEIASFIFLWALPVGVLGLILYFRQRKGADAGQISVE